MPEKTFTQALNYTKTNENNVYFDKKQQQNVIGKAQISGKNHKINVGAISSFNDSLIINTRKTLKVFDKYLGGSNYGNNCRNFNNTSRNVKNSVASKAKQNVYPNFLSSFQSGAVTAMQTEAEGNSSKNNTIETCENYQRHMAVRSQQMPSAFEISEKVGDKSTTMLTCDNSNGNDFSGSNLSTTNMPSSSFIPKQKSPQKIFDFSFETESDSEKCASEYLNEIYVNLLAEEKDSEPRPLFEYMKNQDDINSQMRAILVDWIVEVHLKFKLNEQTLFQCVWIIDTYLSKNSIKRVKLQLLGIAALLISCKQHEIYYPKLDKFVDITDNAYKISELLSMEETVLRSLNFSIVSPNALDFYNILAKAFKFNDKEYYFGRYFTESALLDDFLLKYKSSAIAAACAYIVMKFFGIKNYCFLYSRRVLCDENPQKVIKEAARELCFLVKNLGKSSLKGVKDKFSLDKFMSVAKLCDEH